MKNIKSLIVDLFLPQIWVLKNVDNSSCRGCHDWLNKPISKQRLTLATKLSEDTLIRAEF